MSCLFNALLFVIIAHVCAQDNTNTSTVLEIALVDTLTNSSLLRVANDTRSTANSGDASVALVRRALADGSLTSSLESPWAVLTPFVESVTLRFTARVANVSLFLVRSVGVSAAAGPLGAADSASGEQGSGSNSSVDVVALSSSVRPPGPLTEAGQLVRLGLGETLELTVVYTCNATFMLADRWVLGLLGNSSQSEFAEVSPAPLASLPFEFAKDCRKRGCAERCSEHGKCNYLLGECVCDPSWFGAECQYQFAVTPAAVCRGGSITVSWVDPGDRATNYDWYTILPAAFVDPIVDGVDWRYLISKNNMLITDVANEADLNLNDSYTGVMPLNTPAGNYTVIMYLDDVYIVAAQVFFEVLDWPQCDVPNPRDACDTNPPCSGRGSCAAGELCKCSGHYSWYDCSKGCGDTPVVLTARSGEIRTGSYISGAKCMYDIEPEGVFDSVHIDIADLGLEVGDIVRIERKLPPSDGPTPAPTPMPSTHSTDTRQAPTIPASPGYELVTEFTVASQRSTTVDVKSSEGVRIMLAADFFNVGSGLVATYEVITLPRALTGGEIAGIVIGAIVGAVLLTLCIVGLVSLVKRSRARAAAAAAAAANAPPKEWTAEEEQQVPTVDRSDVANVQTLCVGALQHSMSAHLQLVRRNDKRGLFADGNRARCPVNKKVEDSFTLVNGLTKPIGYSVFVPTDEAAFVCDARPGLGVLAPNERRDIRLSFVLQFTTKVWRYVKVTFDGVDGAYFVPIVLEGDSSLRLDPDNVDLFGKPLGGGAFGVVYRGRYRGTDVAVKVSKHQGGPNEATSPFAAEVALFEKLRCPYFVNFVGASHVPSKQCICTELVARGSVAQVIKSSRIATALKAKMLLDAAEALTFLHENGVIYRDLKLDNLLVVSVSVTSSVNCKLGDFGTALTVKEPYTLAQHSVGIGTPIYMAPELLVGRKSAGYNVQVDIYALAISLWEILAEQQPFGAVKRMWDLPNLVVSGARPLLNNEWHPELRNAIERGWLNSPQNRPKASEMALLLRSAFQKLLVDYQSTGARRKSRAAGSEQARSTTGTSLTMTSTQQLSNSARLTTSGGVVRRTLDGEDTTPDQRSSSGHFTLTSDSALALMAVEDAPENAAPPMELLASTMRARKWKNASFVTRLGDNSESEAMSSAVPEDEEEEEEEES
jgi:serine/threonine protein kinase